MDFSKLADEFVEEGAWNGLPVIAISMFAKWLEEREASQQSTRADGEKSASGVYKIEWIGADVIRLTPGSGI